MSKKARADEPAPEPTHFEIFHWAGGIKELDANPQLAHRVLRPVSEYYAVAEQLHKMGYHVMLIPNRMYLAVDTRTFGQR